MVRRLGPTGTGDLARRRLTDRPDTKAVLQTQNVAVRGRGRVSTSMPSTVETTDQKPSFHLPQTATTDSQAQTRVATFRQACGRHATTRHTAPRPKNRPEDRPQNATTLLRPGPRRALEEQNQDLAGERLPPPPALKHGTCRLQIAQDRGTTPQTGATAATTEQRLAQKTAHRRPFQLRNLIQPKGLE